MTEICTNGNGQPSKFVNEGNPANPEGRKATSPLLKNRGASPSGQTATDVFTITRMQDLRGPRENQVDISEILRRGHDAIPVTDVRLISDEIDKNWIDITGRASPQAEQTWGDVKVELYCRTALFLEDIWEKTLQIRRLLAQEGELRDLEVFSGVSFITKDQMKVYPGVGIHKDKPPDVAIGTSEILTQIGNATKETFRYAVELWEKDREESLQAIPQQQWSSADKSYQRMKDIIRYGNENSLTKAASPREYINKGIGTALDTIWDLFDVSVRVYKKQKGKRPTITQTRQLFESIHPLALQFAMGHLELSIGLLNHMRGNKVLVAKDPFLDHYFAIEEIFAGAVNGEETTRSTLVITDNAFQSFNDLQKIPKRTHRRASTPVSSVTVRCPATYVVGEGNLFPEAGEELLKNLVTQTFNWSMGAAEEYYLPFVLD